METNTMKCSGCLIGCMKFFQLSQASLWEWLIEHNVVPGEMMCKKCKLPAKFFFSSLSFRCWRRRRVRKGSRMVNIQCTFRRCARGGTWFGSSAAPVKVIANYCSLWLCSRYPKSLKLRRLTGFTTLTMANWNYYCRNACISWACNPAQRLGGPGKVIEVAEARFGENRYSLGRKKDVYWVIGGIQRGSSKIFLVNVKKQEKITFLRVLAENVLPGTTVISNCFKLYDIQVDEDSDDDLDDVLKFVRPNNRKIHTRNVQRMLRHLRRFVPKGRKRETFQGYLAEYAFRKAYRPKERLHHFFTEASKLRTPRRTMID